jgi:hypothetical protein
MDVGTKKGSVLSDVRVFNPCAPSDWTSAIQKYFYRSDMSPRREGPV